MFIRTSIMHNNLSLSRSAIVVVVFDEKKRWRKRKSKNTVEQMKCMRNTCSWIYLFLTSYQTKLFLLFLIYFWNARSTIFLLIFIEIVINLTLLWETKKSSSKSNCCHHNFYFEQKKMLLKLRNWLVWHYYTCMWIQKERKLLWGCHKKENKMTSKVD